MRHSTPDNRPQLWIETTTKPSLRTQQIEVIPNSPTIVFNGKTLILQTSENLDDFRISVLDLNGRFVKSFDNTPTDISSLNPGFYIFKIENKKDKKVFYQKQIIK